MSSNEEALQRIKDDMAKEIAKYTFSFNQPAEEQYKRFKNEMEAMLKHLYGEEMRLSPEQQEEFKLAALNAQLNKSLQGETERCRSLRDKFILRCTVQMDEEGRLSLDIKYKE